LWARRERQLEGIQAAKARGVYKWQRPSILPLPEVLEAVGGEIGVAVVCWMLRWPSHSWIARVSWRAWASAKPQA